MRTLTFSSFIILFALICRVRCVCNAHAFARVNATTVNLRGESELHYNVNLNLMGSYRIIEITRANVTEMCRGMVKNFPRLTELNIIGVNITSLEKEVFQKVPVLKKLSLAANNITEIKFGHFNNIKSLETLYLSANRILKIDENAFDDMSQLKYIYLVKNLIQHVNPKWFKNCPNIKLIDLSHNKIRELPQFAFQNVAPAYGQFVKYFLNYNSINYIDPQVLETDKPFLILYLQNNTMEDLPEDLLKNLREVNGLILNNNLITCLSEETLELLRDQSFSLHLINNPIQCPCLKRFNTLKWSYPRIKASFHYNSTENCFRRNIPTYFL